MKTKTITAIIVFGVVLLAVFGIAVMGVQAYRSPLGSPLQMDTPTAIPVNMQVATPIIPSAIPATAVQAAIPAATTCGETAVWNILILGSDAGDNRGVKGSDLTRMMRVDFPNQNVTIYSFPRDLWVDTTGLGLTNPLIQATRLGSVFYEGRIRSTHTTLKDVMTDGTNVTARMLINNFFISTDHYVTIDLNQIPVMIDVVGGVPMNIPQTITDPWIGTVIPAGQQTLNGTQLVAYARVKPDSDFARIQRNNLLVEALRRKLLDPSVWVNIPQLYARFNQTIATDLSPEQINNLSCLMQEVPEQAIVQDQVPPEWTWAGPEVGSLYWDRTKVLNRLMELGFAQ